MTPEFIANALGKSSRKANGGYLAQCPCHEDTTASLSIDEGNNGLILVKCFAGCSQDAVIADLKSKDLWVESKPPKEKKKVIASYDYGSYTKTRFEGKTFGFSHKEGEQTVYTRGCNPLPYQLGLIQAAIGFAVVEGEKDVDSLSALEILATTLDAGAGSSVPAELIEAATGKIVVLIPDNDEPGRNYVDRIGAALAPVAKSVNLLILPGLLDKQDVSDWLAVPGNGKEQLLELISKAPPWKPRAVKTIPQIRTMSDLLATIYAPIRWVLYPILPEGLAILSGAPKIGKSWMVMNLCIATATGGYVFGKFKVSTAEVLLLSLEDNERRMQERSRKCLNGGNQDLSNFHAITTWRRLDQGGLDDLACWLEQHPDCRLVVIDTIQKIKPMPKRKSGTAYENDYDAYGDLQRLALHRHCCILVIHHNRKSDSRNVNDPLEQISGSIGITGAMDTILMLKRPRGATGAVLTATGRDIVEAEYGMTFDGTLGQWAITGQAAELSLSDSNHDILNVLKARQGEEMTVSEINDCLAEKMAEPSLKTYLYRLAKKEVVTANKGKFLYGDTVTSVTGVTWETGVTGVTDIIEATYSVTSNTSNTCITISTNAENDIFPNFDT